MPASKDLEGTEEIAQSPGARETDFGPGRAIL